MSAIVLDTFTTKSVTLNSPLEEGLPGPEHFTIIESTVTADELEEGDILVQVLAMSADPYLRGSIKSGGHNATAPGQVMSGFVSGKVAISKHPDWQVGDFIGGSMKFATFQVVKSPALAKGGMIWKLTGLIADESAISYGIGVLGMPGSTAYGGLIDVLRPLKGETIFISAASGAVGALVGQIAKHLYDCVVIGSCGGPAKCALAKDTFGYDHVIDYKTCENVEQLIAALKSVAPDGIDMYFENVGGMHFEAAMATLRPYGRVAVCGQIAEYNKGSPHVCAFEPMKMIYTCQRIEGFVCHAWLTGKKGNFFSDMAEWLQEGKVKVQETFFEGIDSWPLAFQSLFTGGNTGKVVVRL